MTPKTIVVLGATGGQGGSVVNAFLSKGGWKVRAVTRDPTSAKSQGLQQKGAEVVKGDVNDKNSLIAAFQGANAIFAVTDFWVPFMSSSASAVDVQDLETTQGRNIVDAASGISTLEHFVWSTLPLASKISGGKTGVPHFDGKAVVDDYIMGSPLKDKTTFLFVAFYTTNFNMKAFMPAKITQGGTTTHAHIQATPPSTRLFGLVDHTTAIGAVVSAIIAQPQKTIGRYVLASNGETPTIEEFLTSTSEAAGLKDVKYLQVTDEAFEALHGKGGVELGLMFKFWEKHGGDTGQDLLFPTDLGVTGLKTLKEYLSEQDWSAYH